MKKTQVLSAIALALALGVVAPVASASALTDEVRNDQDQVTTHGKSTCAENVKAAATIKNNASYKRLVAFFDAYKAIAADTTAYGDRSGHAGVTIVAMDATVAADGYNAIAGKYNALPATPNFKTDAMNKATTGVTATAESVKAIKAELDAVTGIYRYNDYKAIYDSLQGDGSISKFEKAIREFDSKYNDVFNTIANNTKDFSTLFADAKAGTGDFAPATEYGKFYELIETVSIVTEMYNAYMGAYNSLEAKYADLNNAGQIKEAGKTAHNAMNLDAGKIVKIDDLAEIVLQALPTAGASAANAQFKNPLVNTTNVWGADDWNALIGTTLEDLTTCDINNKNETEANWDKLVAATVDFGQAIYRDVSTYKLVNTLARELVNGSNVTEGEKPTEDPSKNDVNAPASGILGSAEGSATTISIVAGLTTALTALGAGVVAYRNARREK